MKAKQAVECATLLEDRFDKVIVDATGVEAVVKARGHKTAFRFQRCSGHIHVGPTVRVSNVTCLISGNQFDHLRGDDPFRKYSEVNYCQKCETILSYQLEERDV